MHVSYIYIHTHTHMCISLASLVNLQMSFFLFICHETVAVCMHPQLHVCFSTCIFPSTYPYTRFHRFRSGGSASPSFSRSLLLSSLSLSLCSLARSLSLSLSRTLSLSLSLFLSMRDCRMHTFAIAVRNHTIHAHICVFEYLHP